MSIHDSKESPKPQALTPLERELLDALKEIREACCAGMRVIAEIDTPTKLKALLGTPESRQQAFIDECKVVGVKAGFGVRADSLIQRLEGRS